MRILIVSQYYYPESFRVNDMAAGLTQRGHDVTVLTGQPNYETGSFYDGYTAFTPTFERIESVNVHRCPLVSRGKGTGLRLALNYASFAVTSSALAPLRLSEDFDVTLVFQMSPVTMGVAALVMKRLRHTPVVWWIQDLWPDTLRATGKVASESALSVMRKLIARMYRASERVLVISESFIPAVVAGGFPPSRVSYLPNWAETCYAPYVLHEGAPERLEIPSGFCVMFAGNMGHAQALETIIDAAVLCRPDSNIKWLMVGDGRRKEWAEARVTALGLADRFIFLGRRPVEQMPRYLSLADILLVTLRRDPVFAMTMPSKVQSYLASAKPIVAALDGEGASVIEESGAGLVCPSEDAQGLAEAVLRLAKMGPEDREAMGAAGRRYFEDHFERELLLDQLERWLELAARPGLSCQPPT